MLTNLSRMTRIYMLWMDRMGRMSMAKIPTTKRLHMRFGRQEGGAHIIARRSSLDRLAE